MNKYFVALLATIGAIAILWQILPHWVLGIIPLAPIIFFLITKDYEKDYSSSRTEERVDSLPFAPITSINLPMIWANDNLDEFRHFNNKTLLDLDVDPQIGLVDIRSGISTPLNGGGLNLVLETRTQIVGFPFAVGFDQTDLLNDGLIECIFKIILISEAMNSNEEGEYICFGHPNNFLKSHL